MKLISCWLSSTVVVGCFLLLSSLPGAAHADCSGAADDSSSGGIETVVVTPPPSPASSTRELTFTFDNTGQANDFTTWLNIANAAYAASKGSDDVTVASGIDGISGTGGGGMIGNPYFYEIPVPTIKLPFSRTTGDMGREGNPGPCSTVSPVVADTLVIGGTLAKTETDFVTGGEAPLQLARTYISAGSGNNGVGVNLFDPYWSSSFDYSLGFKYGTSGQACQSTPGNAVSCSGQTVNGILVNQPNGSQLSYTFDNLTDSHWVDHKTTSIAWIVHQGDGTWLRHAEDNGTETYDQYGFILSVMDAYGVGWTFQYSGSHYLQSVTHSSGRIVHIYWTSNRISSVVDPAGNTYTYSYGSNGLLASAWMLGDLAGLRVQLVEEAARTAPAGC